MKNLQKWRQNKFHIIFAGGPVTVSLGVPGTNYVPTVTAVTSGSFPLHFERISEVNSSSNPSHHPQVIFFLILKKNFTVTHNFMNDFICRSNTPQSQCHHGHINIICLDYTSGYLK